MRGLHDPDSDLVARAQSGHKESFGKLVSRYYEMVYGLAYGVVHEREAARDVAQEAFLKAFRQLEGFEGRSKFKTWLYRIAMNTAIDYQRRSRRTEPLVLADSDRDQTGAGVVVPDSSPSPRDLASQSELRERMEEALKQLTPEHRAVLVLREWQGLSYDEVAETLGIELGTVMSRLFYARRRLAEVLKMELPEKKL